MSNLNQINWVTPYDTVYPVSNLPGIQSQNEITPKELNKRLATIRNNNHTLLRALSNLSTKLDGSLFLSEAINAFSEIIFTDTFQYNQATLDVRSRTTTRDVAGNPLTFSSKHTVYQSTNTGTLKEGDNEVLVFLNGLLVSSTNYESYLVYGSLAVYLKSSLISADDEVTIVVVRKFNEFNKTFNKRLIHTVASNDFSEGSFELTIDNERLGNVLSTEHVGVAEVNSSDNIIKYYRNGTDFIADSHVSDNTKIQIRFSTNVSTGDKLYIYNETEFGSETKSVDLNNSTVFDFELYSATQTDHKLPRLPSTNSLYLWVNGIFVDQLYIQNHPTDPYKYQVDFTQVPQLLNNNYIFSTATIDIFAFKTTTYSSDPELKNTQTILGGTLNPDEKDYFSISEDTSGDGTFISMPSMIFQSGKLLTDYDIYASGDKISFKKLPSYSEDIVINQGYTISDGFKDTLKNTVSGVKSKFISSANNDDITDIINNLNMNGSKIYNLANGTEDHHAATLGQINAKDDEYLALVIALS